MGSPEKKERGEGGEEGNEGEDEKGGWHGTHEIGKRVCRDFSLSCYTCRGAGICWQRRSRCCNASHRNLLSVHVLFIGILTPLLSVYICFIGMLTFFVMIKELLLLLPPYLRPPFSHLDEDTVTT